MTDPASQAAARTVGVSPPAVKYRRASVYMLISSIAPAAAQWLMVLLIARWAGPGPVGEYSLALAAATPIFVASQLSLRIVLVSFLIDLSFGTFWWLRLVATMAAVLASGVIWLLFHPASLPIMGWVVAIKVAGSLADLSYAVMQRRQQFAGLALGMATTAAMSIGSVSIVLLAEGSVATALAASAAVTFAMAVTLFWVTLRHEDFRTDWSAMRTLLTAGVPAGVAQSLTAVLSYLPILFVSAVTDHAGVGVFASMVYFFTASNLVMTSIAQTALPGLSGHARNTGPATAMGRARPWLKRMLVLAVPAGGLVAALGGFILPMLYGPGFTIHPIEIVPLGVAIALLPFAQYAALRLMVLNRYRRQMSTAAAAVLVTGIAALGATALTDILPVLTLAGIVLTVSVVIRTIVGEWSVRTAQEGP